MIAVGLLGQFPSEEVAAGIKLAVLLLLFFVPTGAFIRSGNSVSSKLDAQGCHSAPGANPNSVSNAQRAA
jgi:hypothetical protein